MRIDIKNDIEKINYLYDTIAKSVFICINCENFEIMNFKDFYSLNEYQNQDKNPWVWVKIVKNEKKILYIKEIFPNETKSVNTEELDNLKMYLKYIIKAFKYNLNN